MLCAVSGHSCEFDGSINALCLAHLPLFFSMAHQSIPVCCPWTLIQFYSVSVKPSNVGTLQCHNVCIVLHSVLTDDIQVVCLILNA